MFPFVILLKAFLRLKGDHLDLILKYQLPVAKFSFNRFQIS